VLSIVDRWRKYPQPSYSLDTKNCVTFVKEIATALKLPASNDPKFIRSPKEFLEDLQVRTSKTNRIVTIGRSQQPIPGTQAHANETTAVRAENRWGGTTPLDSGNCGPNVMSALRPWLVLTSNASPPRKTWSLVTSREA
jgi:hypothetical protein